MGVLDGRLEVLHSTEVRGRGSTGGGQRPLQMGSPAGRALTSPAGPMQLHQGQGRLPSSARWQLERQCRGWRVPGATSSAHGGTKTVHSSRGLHRQTGALWMGVAGGLASAKQAGGLGASHSSPFSHQEAGVLVLGPSGLPSCREAGTLLLLGLISPASLEQAGILMPAEVSS